MEISAVAAAVEIIVGVLKTRAPGMPFFDPARGGDPLLWQHLSGSSATRRSTSSSCRPPDGSQMPGLIEPALIFAAVAAAIVMLHALKTYRRRGRMPNRRFLGGITVGHDAIATVAIL